MTPVPPEVMAELAAFQGALEQKRARVEHALRQLVRPGESPTVTAAVEDGLFAPAKRLRPVLALMVAEVLGAEPASVLPAGCAVEMVHTASLILDDLPCMDDASTRRGRPALHLVHGEANAVLAAFALLNRAFEVLAEGWTGGPDAATRVELARELAGAVGPTGMITGQAQDLALTGQSLDLPTVELIHSRKTGSLFVASAALAALAAGAPAAEKAALVRYARHLGLAFQVVDDLIDAPGGSSEAGKAAGQDVKKTTFVSFAGIAGARRLVDDLAGASVDALAPFGPRAQPLRDLARYVVARRK
jgi:geranylgeranyl diphosphate synthase type II